MPLRVAGIACLTATMAAALAAGAPSPAEQPAASATVRALERYRAGEFQEAIRDLQGHGRRSIAEAARQFRDDTRRWMRDAPAHERATRLTLTAGVTLELVSLSLNGTPYDYSQAAPLIEWICGEFRRGPASEAERLFQLGSLALLQGARDLGIVLGFQRTEGANDSHLRHATDRFPNDSRFRLIALLTRRPAQLIANRLLRPSVIAFGYSVDERDQKAAMEPLQFMLDRLSDLVDDPVVGEDARLRRGVISFLLGRTPDASEDLQRASRAADPFIRYLALLVRGLIYEQTRETSAALASYTAAHRTVPATAASVALTSLLYREGRRQEAADIAARSTRVVNHPEDPWRIYEFGEYRHFAKHLAALRQEIRR